MGEVEGEGREVRGGVGGGDIRGNPCLIILIILIHYPSFICSSGNVSLLFTYDHGKQDRDETPYHFKFFFYIFELHSKK